jgi:hypothetical protein
MRDLGESSDVPFDVEGGSRNYKLGSGSALWGGAGIYQSSLGVEHHPSGHS